MTAEVGFMANGKILRGAAENICAKLFPAHAWPKSILQARWDLTHDSYEDPPMLHLTVERKGRKPRRGAEPVNPILWDVCIRHPDANNALLVEMVTAASLILRVRVLSELGFKRAGENAAGIRQKKRGRP